MPISDEVRKRVIAASETRYIIAKNSGVSWNTLNRFAEGANIRSDHLDRIGEYFGLIVVDAKKPKGK